MSWRRIWLLSLAFVVALGATTWVLLQRSDAATQIVRRELQALFRPLRVVGCKELDIVDGRLTALEIRLDDPGSADASLLAIERVVV
ncbi:MAG: hypothetical protein JNK15_18965, partial [Planctomycetes bacterium]|nr:hypothetical protein [Planctomycetota bacterium]